MNLVDLIIILLLALGFGLGWYKGFLVSVLNLASYIVAWFASVAGYSALATFLSNNTGFNQLVSYFTSGSEKLADMSLANTDVATLSADKVTEIIQNSNLPSPIADTMQNNIIGRVFASEGMTTLSDYFNQTVTNLALSLISFLIIFIAVRIISMIIIGVVDNVTDLPVLKQFDKLLGGAAGLVQAVIIVAALFAIAPIALSVVQIENASELIEGSLLGKMFFNANMIFSVLKSVF